MMHETRDQMLSVEWRRLAVHLRAHLPSAPDSEACGMLYAAERA